MAPGTDPLPDSDGHGRIRHPLNDPMPQQDELNVTIFYGSGVYASDSFRIYTPLLPGGGGPQREARWLRKRERALKRYRDTQSAPSFLHDTDRVETPEDLDRILNLDLDAIGDCISDEEDVGNEEWRRVVPGGE